MAHVCNGCTLLNLDMNQLKQDMLRTTRFLVYYSGCVRHVRSFAEMLPLSTVLSALQAEFPNQHSWHARGHSGTDLEPLVYSHQMLCMPWNMALAECGAVSIAPVGQPTVYAVTSRVPRERIQAIAQ